MSQKKEKKPKAIKRKKNLETDDDDVVRSKKVRPSQVGDAADIDASIGVMDSSFIADKFAQSIKRHFSSSTLIELEEKYLSSSFFLETINFSLPRSLQSLPTYLEKFSEDRKLGLSAAPSTHGAPHSLIVTSSAIRAANIARAIRGFRTEKNAIAKLFAKHMKLKETEDYLRKTAIGFGVGTPARMKDLLEHGALQTTNLERIVIDGSYLDSKKRGVWDYSEIFRPLMELLNIEELRNRYRQGETQLLVF